MQQSTTPRSKIELFETNFVLILTSNDDNTKNMIEIGALQFKFDSETHTFFKQNEYPTTFLVSPQNSLFPNEGPEKTYPIDTIISYFKETMINTNPDCVLVFDSMKARELFKLDNKFLLTKQFFKKLNQKEKLICDVINAIVCCVHENQPTECVFYKAELFINEINANLPKSHFLGYSIPQRKSSKKESGWELFKTQEKPYITEDFEDAIQKVKEGNFKTGLSNGYLDDLSQSCYLVCDICKGHFAEILKHKSGCQVCTNCFNNHPELPIIKVGPNVLQKNDFNEETI